MTIEDRLRRLEDRAQIEELTKAYGRAIDIRDWDLYASLFGRTVRINYHPGKDAFPSGEILSEHWVEGARQSLGRMKATQHFMSLYAITLEADGAAATAIHYCTASHFQPSDRGGAPTFTEYYIYRFACTREADAWTIAAVDAEVLFAEGNADILSSAMAD